MKTLATFLALLSTALIGQAQSKTINIPALFLWVDSHISVTNGQPITININGNWDIAGPAEGLFDNIAWDDNVPDGFVGGSGDTFLDVNITGSALAYIGTNPFVGTFPTNSGYWEIGSSRQFIATTNGDLWIGMQDDAISHSTNDNGGSVNAQIFTNYGGTNSDWKTVRPVVATAGISSTGFIFNVTDTNMPNSFWAIYDTTDLTNWVLVGATTLDDNGLNIPGEPPLAVNTTGVPYRFYKVGNGQTVSLVIGFTYTEIFPGYNIIADQLIASNNNLDGLFPGGVMADGNSLPNGTQIQKWNGSSYDVSTLSSGAWSPNGSATLNPGEGAFLFSPASNSFMLPFVGTVKEGTTTLNIVSNYLYASPIPQAGGLQSNLDYVPTRRDKVQIYDNATQLYILTTVYGLSGWSAGDPVLSVGEGFFLTPGTNSETWSRTFNISP